MSNVTAMPETMKRYAFMELPAEVERWRDVAKAEGGDLSSWLRRVCRAAARAAEAEGRMPLSEKKAGEK